MEVKKHGRKSRRGAGAKLSLIIMLAAFAVAAFAAYRIYTIFSSYSKADEFYEQTRVDYIDVGDISGEDKSETWWAEDVAVDFINLQAKYPDCVAWIRFDNPDVTNINYPLMWDGTDTTYLRADPSGEYLYSGSLFIEGKNSPDMTDYHTIIYGHNMKDGSMFGTLKQYSWDTDFYESNKYFTIYTSGMAYRYEIYSWHKTTDTSYVYSIGFMPGREYEEFINQTIADSEQDTGIAPDVSQKTVTLSTCTSASQDERLVVHGVCIDQCASTALGSDVSEDDSADDNSVILEGTIE